MVSESPLPVTEPMDSTMLMEEELAMMCLPVALEKDCLFLDDSKGKQGHGARVE